MNKPTVTLDCDGILTTLQSWYDLYNKDYNDNLTRNTTTDWNIHNIVKPECGKNIYRYLELPQVYEQAEVVDGAVKVINELSNYFILQVVTDIRKEGEQARLAWIKKNFKQIKKIYFSPNKNIVPYHILVEDNPLAIVNCIGIPICMDYPYNRNISVKHYRVTNMYEMRDTLMRIRDYI